MARQGGFLVGPSIHGTSKLQKHKLKRGNWGKKNI